jgi:hypothetical protein
VPGPANAPAEPNRLRAAAGVDKPANVASADAEQFGDMLHAEHGGRRVRPVAAGVGAGSGGNESHGKFLKGRPELT